MIERLKAILAILVVALVAAATPASAQGFVNGGFEQTGANLTSNPNNFGWTMDPGTCGTNDGIASDGNAFTGAAGPGTLIVPFDGSFVGWFGAFDCIAGMEQTITDVSGQQYDLKYYLSVSPAYPLNVPNTFDVSLNGTDVFNTQVTNDVWQEFDQQFTGTGSDIFKFLAENDNGGTMLEDVNITPVTTPEPPVQSLMAVGLIGLAAAGRKPNRRRKPQPYNA